MKKNNNAFTENILKDPVLCLQFLKDYVDKDLFQNLKPEDIEDESEKGNISEEAPLYLISLVEHKSQVDYNVSMQILRYIPDFTYKLVSNHDYSNEEFKVIFYWED